MNEVSRNLRIIFLAKIPPNLKVEVGIFFDKKIFPETAKVGNFFISELIMNEVSAKSKNIFLFGREVGR